MHIKLPYRQLLLAATAITLLAAPTQAATTSLYQEVDPGALTINSAGSDAMSGTTANATHDQLTSGSLGAVNVTDNRGSAAGWSATMTASNFTYLEPPVRVSGSTGGITLGGSFTGNSSTPFTVTITAAGPVGSSQFSVTGVSGPLTTAAGDIALGSTGLTVRFSAGTYQVGDQWTFRDDVIPASNLTVTMPNVNGVAGGYQGVQPGPVHSFSDSSTIMSAPAGSGMGFFTDIPSLALTIPASTHSGTYVATITETVN